MTEIKIETTLLKVLFLRMATWADTSREVAKRLEEIRARLEGQSSVAREHTGCTLGERGAFSFPDTAEELDHVVLLRLSLEDIQLLYARAGAKDIRWPYTRMSDDMTRALNQLIDEDLPAWEAQAEAEKTWAQLSPEQRKALKQRPDDEEPPAEPRMEMMGPAVYEQE